MRQGWIYHRKLDKSRARDEVCALGKELLGRLDGQKEVSHGA